MKKYILLLLSLFTVSSVGYSQTENKDKHAFPGITNWEEVIAKATLDNKYIMVDLSTEWCSWCKVMDKQHFRDPEILSLMTPKLNSYMLDAERDSIGAKFASNCTTHSAACCTSQFAANCTTVSVL